MERLTDKVTIIAGSTARAQRCAPVRLTAITRSHSFGSISRRGLRASVT